jgi:hypothetical protein
MQYPLKTVHNILKKSCSAKVYGRYINDKNMFSWSIQWYIEGILKKNTGIFMVY